MADLWKIRTFDHWLKQLNRDSTVFLCVAKVPDFRVSLFCFLALWGFELDRKVRAVKMVMEEKLGRSWGVEDFAWSQWNAQYMWQTTTVLIFGHPLCPMMWFHYQRSSDWKFFKTSLFGNTDEVSSWKLAEFGTFILKLQDILGGKIKGQRKNQFIKW